MVTRRAFIGTIAGGLLAAPLAAEAPPPADSPTSEDIAAKLAAIGDHPPSPEAAATSAFPDFTAPSGQTLDVDAVVALRGMELSHDVPVAELTAPTNEYKAAWERRGGWDEPRDRDARPNRGPLPGLSEAAPRLREFDPRGASR